MKRTFQLYKGQWNNDSLLRSALSRDLEGRQQGPLWWEPERNTPMVEVKIRVTEEQLAEMDRMVRGGGVTGRRWLQDAVGIYKEILCARQRRLDAFQRLRVVEKKSSLVGTGR